MEEIFPDETRAHCAVYLQLWAIIQQHITSGETPVLSECKKPKEAWKWRHSLNSDIKLVSELDLSEEESDDICDFQDMVADIDETADTEEE